MLPKDILIKRVRNELKECKRSFRHKFSHSKIIDFPFEIKVKLIDAPGPIWRDGKLETKYEHELKIIITDSYPYQTPIVRWQSDIFHPNIMPPEDGGYVCTKLLDKWTFNSNLIAFIKGIEVLLSSPNPKSPFENDTCTRAAEYFNKHVYKPVEKKRKKPVIIGENGKN